MAKLKLFNSLLVLTKLNRIVAAEADVEQTADPISRVAANTLAHALISSLLLTASNVPLDVLQALTHY
jgi:hypothetical protein